MAFPERIYSGGTTIIMGRAREFGAPKDITGWEVHLKLTRKDEQKEVLGAVVDGPQGLFQITIPKSVQLSLGKWSYEVYLKAGNDEYVVDQGTVDVVSRL